MIQNSTATEERLVALVTPEVWWTPCLVDVTLFPSMWM